MAEFTFPHPLKAKTHSLFKILPKINSNDLNSFYASIARITKRRKKEDEIIKK